MRLQWSFFREAADQWLEHNAPRLGAALAYYTILSLAPLLVVVVALCGLAFGDDAVRGQLYWEIKDVVGSQGAAFVQSLLVGAHEPATGITASAAGFVVLIAGASGVFGELRDTLNYIWDAPVPKSSGFGRIVRYRVFCFAMVLGFGFLLVVSLALSAGVQALGSFASHRLAIDPRLLEIVNFAVTIVVTGVLFALIYRVIPEVPIDWADVGVGAAVTAVFFAVGKFLIGFYLGTAGVGSAYGAAGSLVVLLVWVYYSAQIFLYGAEFTHVYASHRGSPAIQSAISNAGLPAGSESPPQP
ncbi:MAG: YihY/virulence factor BrkB family protein [Acidobacteriota bacterium]|nr:YihY/virulence factor BrkB family protein [Acidobacteriota bacterium]